MDTKSFSCPWTQNRSNRRQIPSLSKFTRIKCYPLTQFGQHEIGGRGGYPPMRTDFYRKLPHTLHTTVTLHTSTKYIETKNLKGGT